MAGRNIFPVANATRPYWRSQLSPIDSHRSTKQLPKECDVLIIGAGLSGVSTAYHLFDDNPSPPSIVLLEAREICSGATGRNGGHLFAPHSYVDRLVRENGIDAAREAMQFQKQQMYAMKSVVEKEKLDCDAVLTRYFEVFLTQSHNDRVKAHYEDQLKAGLDFIQDVDYVGPKYVEIVSYSIVTPYPTLKRDSCRVLRARKGEPHRLHCNFGPTSSLQNFCLA